MRKSCQWSRLASHDINIRDLIDHVLFKTPGNTQNDLQSRSQYLQMQLIDFDAQNPVAPLSCPRCRGCNVFCTVLVSQYSHLSVCYWILLPPCIQKKTSQRPVLFYAWMTAWKHKTKAKAVSHASPNINWRSGLKFYLLFTISDTLSFWHQDKLSWGGESAHRKHTHTRPPVYPNISSPMRQTANNAMQV